jgi:hypothetical protein
VLAAIAFAAPGARANEGITGYSGKPYFGVTDTCKTTCHSPTGTPPTLDINVPATIKAGETGQVTVVVSGTRVRTSFNAAFSDGVKATQGQNTEIPFPVQTPGEVGATAPPPAGAKGTYKFSFVAPNKNGAITLWIAGMSASGAGADGDGVATATRTIMVSGATAPSTTSTTSSGGASPGTTGDAGGSTTSSASSSGGTSSSSGEDPSDPSTSSGRRLQQTGGGEGGCALAIRTHGSDRPLGFAALMGLVLLFRSGVRRRRPPDQ